MVMAARSSPRLTAIAASLLARHVEAMSEGCQNIAAKVIELSANSSTQALYGGMVFGVLPFQPGVSWQGHLFGAIAGVLLGLRLGRADRVVRRPVI